MNFPLGSENNFFKFSSSPLGPNKTYINSVLASPKTPF